MGDAMEQIVERIEAFESEGKHPTAMEIPREYYHDILEVTTRPRSGLSRRPEYIMGLEFEVNPNISDVVITDWD
jgi:hypothetical protein